MIKDEAEQYPSFQKLLMCSLDYSLVQIYIMLFFTLDRQWGPQGNSLLSIFIVFLVEKALRSLRSSLGAKNLSKKAHIDKRFLI